MTPLGQSLDILFRIAMMEDHQEFQYVYVLPYGIHM